MTSVLFILLFVLYLKIISVIIFLPFQLLNNIGKKCHVKFLTFPYKAIQKITRGGMERACILEISTVPSMSLRRLYYKLIGCKISKKVVIHFKTEIRCPYKLSIGEGSIIGDNAILDARQGLIIGKNVNLSSNVSIYTLQHNHRSPNFDCNFPNRKLDVYIGDRVWLGSNVIILPGVKIGEGAVVCAGAVVTKDVSPFSIVSGIPANKIGERTQNLTYEFNGNSCWFY